MNLAYLNFVELNFIVNLLWKFVSRVNKCCGLDNDANWMTWAVILILNIKLVDNINQR